MARRKLAGRAYFEALGQTTVTHSHVGLGVLERGGLQWPEADWAIQAIAEGYHFQSGGGGLGDLQRKVHDEREKQRAQLQLLLAKQTPVGRGQQPVRHDSGHRGGDKHGAGRQGAGSGGPGQEQSSSGRRDVEHGHSRLSPPAKRAPHSRHG